MRFRDRPARLIGAVTAIATAATVLVACVPESAPTPSGVAVTEAFEKHGIAVLEDVAEDWPADALMASPAYAVAVMQAEVDSHGGMPGADLDELTPMPPGVVPFSYLIAAWLSEESTPRAQAARTWFAETEDWSRAPSIWYPRAALLLFVADAMEASITDFGTGARVDSLSQPAARGAGVVPAASVSLTAQALVSAPCSTVSGFFRDTVDAIFRAVQLPPDFLASGGVLGAISGFLAGLYNTAVQLAKKALLTVIESIAAPALRAIGSAVAIVGVVSHVSSYLLGVKMTLVSSEPVIDLDGSPGSWFGLIDSNRPLEAQLNDCLAALGQKPLPDIVKSGERFTWRGEAPRKANNSSFFEREALRYVQPQIGVIDEGQRLVIPFDTAVDPASSKPEELGFVRVTADVPRGDVTELFQAVERLLDQAVDAVADYGGPFKAQVKAAIQQILFPIFQRLKNEILSAGRSLLMIIGSGEARFVYREPDDPAPPAGVAVPNCYVGSWRYAGVSSRWLDLSRSAFSRFTLDIGADGSYAVRVAGWATYQEGLGGFWTTYEGGTRFTVAPGADGVWAVTAPRLSASETYAALYLPLGNGYVLGADDSGGAALPYIPPDDDPGSATLEAADDGIPDDDGQFGLAVFGAGLRPIAFACSADGATLTITGEADGTYGSAIWTFRRS